MKNRKREICTSGTVRDEDGNVLIYSANVRGDRGNVGIIRSPVRATILPDQSGRGTKKSSAVQQGIVNSGNGGISVAAGTYSGLMLAARITLPHFSVSSAISLPKSAGEPASTVPPRSAMRALILGSARPALISFLSLSMISMAVFLGAPRPYQALAAAQAHKRHLRAVL
jgi:hypothetical protein